ncbi:MAG: carboxypeptidase regulatory-like domain-containing protein [Lentimicrobiaceae bacterium]|nr:carboxypeptidase regulatory-like domain-containing protein [Lentimicrobiaceae bacterium]
MNKFTTFLQKNIIEMKKIILIIIVSLLSIHFLNASCIDDRKIWSERIFTGDYYSAIFTCKVLEFSSENQVKSTAGILGLRAVVQVEKVFFGKVDTIVNLDAGFSMKVGRTYLIYGRGYRNNFSFDGYCTVHSMEVPDIKDGGRISELEILTDLSNIINNKQTCSYTMLNLNNKKFAEGSYKNGKPAGIWKHYLWNGNIKAEYNFEENSEIQYYDNGLKNHKLLKSETEEIFYKYSTIDNDFLTFKYILKNTDYGHLITWFFYYDNGNLEKQYTTKSLGGRYGYGGTEHDGYYMDYQEFYENGKIKAKGNLFNNDSVGTWYFYNEEGRNTGKKVYEDVDSDKLLAIEKEQIEKNKPYKLEKSSMYGKITDKNTGKGIGGVNLSLFRDGNLYTTAFAQTWDDGSYYMENIPIGKYEIRVEDFGSSGYFGTAKRGKNYGTAKKEIEIKKDEELEFNLQLEATNN